MSIYPSITVVGTKFTYTYVRKMYEGKWYLCYFEHEESENNYLTLLSFMAEVYKFMFSKEFDFTTKNRWGEPMCVFDENQESEEERLSKLK